MGIWDNIKGELKTRNFSIYGQWIGILCIFLCIALGFANCFHLSRPLIIIFAIICIVSGFVLIFLEIPFLLRICPTSKKFDEFIRKFHNNYGRAGMYLTMSIVQWGSIGVDVTSLIACAIMLLAAGVCYLLAGLKGQQFQGSKTLGGAGVVQAMV